MPPVNGPHDYDEAMTHDWSKTVQTAFPPLSAGSVYQLDDNTNARVHYVSSSCILYERLDGNSHPFRIVRKSDGRLLGVYHERSAAVKSWDTWFKDGSHA